MFLRDVTIHNVRCIENVHISFESHEKCNRKWTLILGENGCGKSTVLRGIALLLAGSDALPHLLGRDVDSWVHYRAKEARIDASLVTAEDEPRNISLRIPRGANISDLFEMNSETLRQLDFALRHTERSYLAMGYGPSRRLSSTEDSAFHGSTRVPLRARAVMTLFFPEAILAPLEAWVIEMDYRGDGRWGRQLMKRIASLMPEVTFDSIDKKEKRLMFNTPDGVTPLSQLSDGYQNMAAWCGDLLRSITDAFEHYKDPLTCRGLLLIDEIDLHLHPVWQRRLREYLENSFPNLQIIATTHSPLTVQQSGEGELHVMQRDEPKSSPTLRAFEGVPNTMMLHQLLVSPIFNLSSMDSVKVEEKREQYRVLKSKKDKSAADTQNLNSLRATLESLPDFAEGFNKYKQEQLDVLEDIKKAIASTGSGKSKSGVRSVRSTGKDRKRPPTKKKSSSKRATKKPRRKGKK